MKQYCIDLLHLFRVSNTAHHGLSLGVDLQLFAVENPDGDVVGVFCKNIRFIVDNSIRRQINFSVGLDALKVKLIKLPDGPVFG